MFNNIIVNVITGGELRREFHRFIYTSSIAMLKNSYGVNAVKPMLRAFSTSL